jgi:hypothetical protein
MTFLVLIWWFSHKDELLWYYHTKLESKCICIFKDPDTETAWQWLGWGMACSQSVGRQTECKCDSPTLNHFCDECEVALRPAMGMYVNLTAWHTLTPLADGLGNGWRHHFLHLHHFSVLWFKIVPLILVWDLLHGRGMVNLVQNTPRKGNPLPLAG